MIVSFEVWGKNQLTEDVRNASKLRFRKKVHHHHPYMLQHQASPVLLIPSHSDDLTVVLWRGNLVIMCYVTWQNELLWDNYNFLDQRQDWTGEQSWCISSLYISLLFEPATDCWTWEECLHDTQQTGHKDTSILHLQTHFPRPWQHCLCLKKVRGWCRIATINLDKIIFTLLNLPSCQMEDLYNNLIVLYQ